MALSVTASTGLERAIWLWCIHQLTQTTLLYSHG